MRTLVLDLSYRPIAIIGWQKAFTLFFNEKVEIVETYDKEIRTISSSFKVPSIIRTFKNVNVPRRVFKHNKRSLYTLYGGKCAYCDKELNYREATLDHIRPKSKGGTRKTDNLVLACYGCNQFKGDKTLEECGFNKNIKPRPLPPNKILDGPQSWNMFLINGLTNF